MAEAGAKAQSPLERAARAAYTEDWPDPIHATWDETADDMRERYRGIARAVIEAIRECDTGSPAMLAAGKISLYSCSADPELEDARRCWQTMIDVALEEG